MRSGWDERCSAMEKLLVLKEVFKGYGRPGSHSFRPVLAGLNWELEAGTRTAIVGPSGSGKTTLLNLIGALDRPDRGEICFNGRDISGYSEPELALFRNSVLGFVFQQHHLLPQLTLLENVLLPLLATKKAASAVERQWAESLLHQTGLWEQRHQKPGELSGGECQRTAVVRALINKPQLLLADEPTGALDEKNASLLADLLLSISREQGLTLVTVTHSPDVASRMDQRFHLRDGQLLL